MPASCYAAEQRLLIKSIPGNSEFLKANQGASDRIYPLSRCGIWRVDGLLFSIGRKRGGKTAFLTPRLLVSPDSLHTESHSQVRSLARLQSARRQEGGLAPALPLLDTLTHRRTRVKSLKRAWSKCLLLAATPPERLDHRQICCSRKPAAEKHQQHISRRGEKEHGKSPR